MTRRNVTRAAGPGYWNEWPVGLESQSFSATRSDQRSESAIFVPRSSLIGVTGFV